MIPPTSPGNIIMTRNLSIDALVLGTVNASLPRSVTADTLVAVVRGDMDGARCQAHLIALFTEVSLTVLDQFFREHRIAAGQALACYQHWVRPTDPKPVMEQWLDERRRLENPAA